MKNKNFKNLFKDAEIYWAFRTLADEGLVQMDKMEVVDTTMVNPLRMVQATCSPNFQSVVFINKELVTTVNTGKTTKNKKLKR